MKTFLLLLTASDSVMGAADRLNNAELGVTTPGPAAEAKGSCDSACAIDSGSVLSQTVSNFTTHVNTSPGRGAALWLLSWMRLWFPPSNFTRVTNRSKLWKPVL